MRQAAATSDPRIRAMLRAVGRRFGLGRLCDAATLSAGHIHDTFLVTYADANRPRRFVHQRINQQVFRDPARLMENVERVTDHLHARLGLERVPSQSVRHALTLLRARDGRSYCIDDAGAYWRTYVYIEGACTHSTIDSPLVARDAAAAFGRFVRLLADLPGSRLHEIIPHFHDSARYLKRLHQAADADIYALATSARAEIDFAFENEQIAHMLASFPRDALPKRVVHSDTKIENVLFDAVSGEALCVIDLDTVMPGSVLYDFGDLVRSAASASREDTRELSQVYLRLPIFEGLVQGYGDALLSLLTEEERDLLALAGKLVTFEVGVRFLTDYLQGDIYFKTRYSQHNLDRARNQFKLVRSMQEQEPDMRAIVRRIWN